ncbi:hypothetical protein PQ472_06820 [Lacticaseibacillus pabuli]|uniref:Uncharacterized protein n=1 Tax=Lacticaseibacillus pabuli TaxID=3025672 RepID=A0ABY7WN64_9LACO|nr:hypothetical protein [Lacticaseibacillus sp. KACC 23028]WDF81643.1 hypothetical protein PQ472_06820 [Lacticaseibacillus sp. KACC 23028]
MAIWQIVIIIAVIIIGVALGVYLAVRSQQAKTRTQMWLLEADSYVTSACDNLSITPVPQGQPVGKVWGRKVALVGFETTSKLPKQAELAATITRVSDGKAVLSDYWQRDGSNHFEVALLKNKETQEYLDDLKRIRYHNG